MKIPAGAIVSLMGMAYKLILRDLLKAAIDNPDTEWDEWVLKVCDSIFGYEE